MRRARLTSVAAADYAAAVEWYLSQDVGAASRFDDELNREIEAIEANPELCPYFADRDQFRLMRQFPFSIQYRQLPDQIAILSIRHHSRG